MSHDLCSPYLCNICLMLNNYEEESDPSIIPAKAYQNLLSCSGCQLVKYCSSQHQKIDWPIHREFCQAVQKIKKIFNITHPFYVSGEPSKQEDVERSLIQIKYLVKTSLARNLQYQEEELTSFPAYCPVCFKFQFLKALCSTCHSQAYCSEQHRALHMQEHKKVCNLLQIYYCPYKVLPLKEDDGLSIKGQLEDFQNMDLVEAFEKLFLVKLNEKPYHDLSSYQLFSYASDFSCIMTICFVLREIKVDLKDLVEYNILIIGATVEALLWFQEKHCQLFFILNPNIKKLNISFVGPELTKTDRIYLKFPFKGVQRLVIFKYFKGLFQDYCKHFMITDHLIVVFNCGFSEFSHSYNGSATVTNLNAMEYLDDKEIKTKNTWFRGIVEILQTFGIPIVFTSFTKQESQFDYAALHSVTFQLRLKVRVEHILKPTKNPFRDLRPLRQWYTHDKEEFYYRNGYVQAVLACLDK